MDLYGLRNALQGRGAVMGCFNHTQFPSIQQAVPFTAGSHPHMGKGTRETLFWFYVTATSFSASS